jgi:hypothetical protein
MTTATENITQGPHYEQAEDWYNATPKADVIAFCEAQGVSLMDAGQLACDWNEKAIAARVAFLSKAV